MVADRPFAPADILAPRGPMVMRHPRDHYPWYACAVLTLAYALAYMDRSVLTLLVQPIEREFGLSDSAMGLLIGAAFAVCYAVVAVPIALASDRGDRRRLIAIGLVVWCVATCLCGLVQSVPTLFAARIGVAVGEAVLLPAAASILSDYFPGSRRTWALSVFSLGVYLGGGLALLGGGSLLRWWDAYHPALPWVGEVAPWRAVFLILGLVGLFVAPLIWRLREPSRGAWGSNGPATRLIGSDVADEFKRKRLALLALYLGFGTITLGSFAVNAWAPTIFIRVHGWTAATAGARLGPLPLICGPAGALCGAALANLLHRRGRPDAKLIVGILSGIASASAALVMATSTTGIALVGMALLQLVLPFTYGVLHAAIVDVVHARVRALAVAVYTVVTSVFSMTVGPLAVGLLTDHVFRDPKAVGASLAIVAPAAFLTGALILAIGLRPYRQALVLSTEAPAQAGDTDVLSTEQAP